MRGKREAESREEAGCMSTLSSSGLTRGSRSTDSESGRSMLEMLGVLVIMGVLAVGGITGYRYAMDKYNANEIINEVKKRAVVISQQLAVGGSVETPEFKPETEQGYGVEQVLLDDGFFSIIVSDVPQGVCARIVETEWALPVAMYAGSVMAQGEGSICQENNRMQFEFTNDLRATDEKPEHCTQKSDCSSKCDDCIDGVCLENCPAGQGCATRTVSAGPMCCDQDLIVNNVCCVAVRIGANGEKECCARIRNDEPDLCCPAGTFWGSGSCRSCDDPKSYSLSPPSPGAEMCSMCPNRVQDSAFYCRLTCPEGMIEVNGQCKCPIDKPLHGVNSQGGRCFACDEGADSGYVWDNPVGVTGVGTACNWCNFNHGGGYCWRCTPGKVAVGGNCVDCSTVDVAALKYKAQCESCGGTWNGAWNDGTCAP